MERISFDDRESLNQSYNANPKNSKSLPEMKKLPLTTMICLIILPIVFIIIGIIYRNSCRAKPNLPIFLIIFGLLILINLFIYLIVGATFLELIRRARSISSEKGIERLIGGLLGILFGIIIFIWWIFGTIWWIKLSLRIRPEWRSADSLAFCHPVVYWTALIANIFGLIGFIVQICIAISGGMTASKQ